jgi:hypothetical protein
MPIPAEIQILVNQLNQELVQVEQKAQEGLSLVSLPLSRFPENTLLIQFAAYINNVLFFAESYRQRIQNTIDQFMSVDMISSEFQETGEELSAMLGVVLETKMRIERIVDRLRDLP